MYKYLSCLCRNNKYSVRICQKQNAKSNPLLVELKSSKLFIRQYYFCGKNKIVFAGVR